MITQILDEPYWNESKAIVEARFPNGYLREAFPEDQSVRIVVSEIMYPSPRPPVLKDTAYTPKMINDLLQANLEQVKRIYIESILGEGGEDLSGENNVQVLCIKWNEMLKKNAGGSSLRFFPDLKIRVVQGKKK